MSDRGGLRYDRFEVNGRSEWLMRVGPDSGSPILLIPPLFEEMNRTRALLVAVMRSLAAEGFCCTLPDLPGTGESERALEDCSWADWRDAVATAARKPGDRATLIVASFRGGVLLDDVPNTPCWRLSPVTGRSLLRDLSRSGLTGGAGNAGYSIAEPLAAALAEAAPPDVPSCRTVRLASDAGPAEAKLDGPALWRRSEPATSSELAELIASDIAKWARACANC